MILDLRFAILDFKKAIENQKSKIENCFGGGCSMDKWLAIGAATAVGLWLVWKRKKPPEGIPQPEKNLYWYEGRWRAPDEVGAIVAASMSAVPDPASSKEKRVFSFFVYIEQAAQEFKLESAVIASIIDVESRGYPDARGRDGEYGLMQILPGTADQMEFKGDYNELLNPSVNIRYGAKYLRWQLNRYADKPNKVYWAIAAYNAGTAVPRDSKFKNQGYVNDVSDRLKRYAYLFNLIYKEYGALPKSYPTA